MRLESLKQPKGMKQRLGFAVMQWLVGRVPGPILTFSHRPHFFGRTFSACLQQAMRGPSEFSVGERELFAAFVSKLNDCQY
jgi:hypothetical protein